MKFFDKQLKQKDYEIQRMSAELNNPLQKSDKVRKAGELIQIKQFI